MKSCRMSFGQTVNAISVCHQVSDLWDETLSEDVNAHNMVFRMRPYCSYRFRLLGPFLNVRRFYLDSSLLINSWISHKNFVKIVHGDLLLAEAMISKLRSIMDGKKPKYAKNRNEDHYPIAGHYLGPVPNSESDESKRFNFLKKITTPSSWQKCTAVNALLRESQAIRHQSNHLPLRDDLADDESEDNTGVNLKLYMITPSVMRSILGLLGTSSSYTQGEDNLTGLNACDIVVNRPNNSFGYEVSIEPPSMLNPDEIEYIWLHGLFNIEAILRECNNYAIKYKSGHLYKRVDGFSYMRSNEFVKSLFDKCENYIHGQGALKHMEKVESELNELPHDAFENYANISNSISSLEV